MAEIIKPIKYFGVRALGACVLIGPGMFVGHLVSDGTIEHDKAAIHNVEQRIKETSTTNVATYENQIAHYQQDITKNSNSNDMLLGAAAQLPVDAAIGMMLVLTFAGNAEERIRS